MLTPAVEKTRIGTQAIPLWPNDDKARIPIRQYSQCIKYHYRYGLGESESCLEIWGMSLKCSFMKQLRNNYETVRNSRCEDFPQFKKTRISSPSSTQQRLQFKLHLAWNNSWKVTTLSLARIDVIYLSQDGGGLGN